MLKRRLSLRRRQIPERTEVTQQRLETAGRDCRARKFEECLDGWRQAAQVRSDIAEAQGAGTLLVELGEYRRATASFEEAIRLDRERKDPIEMADILCRVGECYGGPRLNFNWRPALGIVQSKKSARADS
jgi:tetratricopeptide (TPR) repeat protein